MILYKFYVKAIGEAILNWWTNGLKIVKIIYTVGLILEKIRYYKLKEINLLHI
jgi:hypothetical protein